MLFGQEEVLSVENVVGGIVHKIILRSILIFLLASHGEVIAIAGWEGDHFHLLDFLTLYPHLIFLAFFLH